jgi:acyl-CoA synthetase (AMP-forming)/AMP-acid ligase II
MHTGDIASRDDEGHYFIVDRKKDLIITGGFNVYPAEIERVVASHPAVAMVAVGSVPDETLGELARAYVVLPPAPPPSRPRSSSTADHTWPRTSCPAPSGSCPICPRRQPAK